jgi:hypothetical protein
MKNINSLKLYLAISALALVLVSGGCATMSPKLEGWTVPPLGTTYTISQTATGSYGSGTSQITAKFDERMWEGKRMIAVVSPTAVTLSTPDGHWPAILAPDGKPIMTFEPPIGYEYPLEVGKTWNKSYRVTMGANKQTISFDSTWKVEAYEDVTVPAGTFKAFKVSYSDTTGVEALYWSSPDVTMWIKRVETRTAKFPAGPGTRETQLISFTIPK